MQVIVDFLATGAIDACGAGSALADGVALGVGVTATADAS